MAILKKKTKKDDTAAKKVSKSSSKAESRKADTAKKTELNSQYVGVLLRPLVTEKSTMNGTYAFEVAVSANKSQIKKAVKDRYGVEPKSVRVMNMNGKVKRWNYRLGKRRDWKKAIIRLNEGDVINVYEGV